MKLVDLAVVALAVRDDMTEYRKNQQTLERSAIVLAHRVVAGECDPVVAEAQLDAALSKSKPSTVEFSPKQERATAALARLVTAGTIDEIFAQNILDTRFERSSVAAAYNHVPETK